MTHCCAAAATTPSSASRTISIRGRRADIGLQYEVFAVWHWSLRRTTRLRVRPSGVTRRDVTPGTNYNYANPCPRPRTSSDTCRSKHSLMLHATSTLARPRQSSSIRTVCPRSPTRSSRPLSWRLAASRSTRNAPCSSRRRATSMRSNEEP